MPSNCRSEADRRRFFEIAVGSALVHPESPRPYARYFRDDALECAANQDVLEVCDALRREQSAEAKRLLDRLVAMLTKLGQRGYSVNEPTSDYNRMGDSDPDTDTDPDTG